MKPDKIPPRIDAHQHFWQLGRFDTSWLDWPALAPIRRDFLPDNLAPLLAAAGVSQSIFVQTQHNVEENRWVLGLAERHPFLAGVVGWVDLPSEQCGEQVAEFRQFPKFVGARHVVQDEPDEDWIVRPAVLRGLAELERAGLVFDLLFYTQHLRHAPTVAARLPGLTLVLDHLAKPKIAAGQIEDWQRDLQAAARFPNLHCKLSGLVTEANWQTWQPADLRPYVRAALDAFGPERCLFGSDWPVCLLAAPYGRVVEALEECVRDLSAAERAGIFGGNAERVYRLAR